MVRESIVASLLLAAAVSAASAQAQPTWPRQIAADLVRLGHVEWRLRREAAGHCPEEALAAGFVLDYIGAYEPEDRPYVRAETGLGTLPRILSVEPDSPAAAAGLAPGDELLGFSGKSIGAILTELDNGSLLADAIQERIGAMSPRSALELVVLRKGRRITVRLEPVKVCSARVVLKTDESIEAYSDGKNVAVTWGLMRFAASSDELALVAGHELGHLIAGEGMPAGLFGSLRMEDAADLTGARLAHCAGFNLTRGLRFWERFARKDLLGWLRRPTHRSARGRLKRIEAAIPTMTCEQI